MHVLLIESSLLLSSVSLMTLARFLADREGGVSLSESLSLQRRLLVSGLRCGEHFIGESKVCKSNFYANIHRTDEN